MSTLLSSLALAAVSGLAYVAYRHPEGYRLIATWIAVLVSIPWIFYLLMGLAELSGLLMLLIEYAEQPQRVSSDHMADLARRIRKGARRLALVFIVGLGVLLYLGFLWVLPSVLRLNGRNQSGVGIENPYGTGTFTMRRRRSDACGELEGYLGRVRRPVARPRRVSRVEGDARRVSLPTPRACSL